MGMVIFPFRYPDSMLEIADLRKTQVNRKKEPCSYQQDHEPGMASEIAVKHYKKIVQLMHVTNINIFIVGDGIDLMLKNRKRK